MELILDVLFDKILSLLGKVTRNSKTTRRTQMIVDILVTSVAILVVVWSVINDYRKGIVLIAAIFAFVVISLILMKGFVILFRNIRKKKEEMKR